MEDSIEDSIEDSTENAIGYSMKYPIEDSIEYPIPYSIEHAIWILHKMCYFILFCATYSVYEKTPKIKISSRIKNIY